jgi:hypothetical protein
MKSNPIFRVIIPFIILTVFYAVPVAFSAAPTPTPTADSAAVTQDSSETQKLEESSKEFISTPQAVPTEANPANQAPSANQKPSQGEGEKAPIQARPTAVPEFSLPEVVITGENELTIGATRLDQKENDITLESHDLTGVDRAFNDLPGIEKTFTALSTEEAGPANDTAFILHAGGGVPGTYGGWGLFGQQFKTFQYLLTGFYSTWAGEPTAGGLDGDWKYKYGLDAKYEPNSNWSIGFDGAMSKTNAELPYQNSIRESRQGMDLSLDGHWKLSDLAQAQLQISNQSTTLTYWDQSDKSNQTQELGARAKISADDVDPFFNRFSAELGGRHASSDFAGPAAGGYDWAWLALQSYLKHGESLGLTVKLQGQVGDGLELPAKLFPDFDLMWRAFQTSQFDLYWRTDRYVESFHDTFMDTEHVSPEAGFPSPTEITGEWGGRFTQKINEKIVASVSGSVAQIDNYHQWSDIDYSYNSTTPLYIQDYSTLPSVQMIKAAANLQWSFNKNWQASATYEWTRGTNDSGNGLNLTGLPTNRGVLSLYRGDDNLETRLALLGATDRQAFENSSVLLPAYVTVHLDAAYHLTKTFTLWLNGDNLLGQAYQVQPGYLEPQFHVRAGIEVIF